jgi:acyl-CoA reductase-like NAD-dependent aldehyde dehydrogenase
MVSDCNLDDFQKAIHSADEAQRNFYESTTGTSRGALLRKWNDLILENQDDRKFALHRLSLLYILRWRFIVTTILSLEMERP